MYNMSKQRVFLLLTAVCDVPALYMREIFEDIRNTPLPDPRALVADLLPTDKVPTAYIDSLDDENECISLKSSILVYFASKGVIVPRLEANNALADGLEIVVSSGTGSGVDVVPNHP
ncbi:hypothetical protein DFH09DRAFT_1448970 [Mycena vulgaris]|nr:hypothetical protein DFH09DRAFT_1448970 [Mycena vulgaris]